MLDINDVATQLGNTPSGVRKLVAKKEIKYFQHGKHGRIKFKQEWIDEFIDKNTIAPKSELSTPKPKTKKPLKHKMENATEGFKFNWNLMKT